MAIPNKTPKLYGVSDLRIYKMLTDVAGSQPTYDTMGIDMPGVQSISISGDPTEVEGKGDERVLEVEYQDDKSSVAFSMLYAPMDAMAIINGGTVDTDSDVDAAVYYGPAPDEIGEYFKIEALTKSRKEKLIIYKAKGRLFPNDGLKSGTFGDTTFKGSAIHTTGNINGKPRRFGLVQASYVMSLGGIAQVETATVVGTITTAGNAVVTITAAGMTGSPKTINVPVSLADSASVVAQKIRENLVADTAVNALFIVGGTGTEITLTRKIAAANDSTLNISITNGTCAGLTDAPTSESTTTGQPA